MLATKLTLFLTPLLPVTETEATTSAWGDVDRDGLQDFYVTDARRGDRLFRNQGDGRFEDVTEAAGLAGNLGTKAALWQDFDLDDNLDLLLVTGQGDVRLYRGVGTGLFQLAGGELGLETRSDVRGAEWNDYDADGWSDIVLELADGAPLFYHSLEGQSFERFEPDLGPVLVEDPGGPFTMTVVEREVVERDGERSAPGASVDGPPSAPGGRTVLVPTAPEGLEATRSATTIANPTGTAAAGSALAMCSDRLVDQATSSCITASSAPQVGALYPLSQDLCVEASGDVGMGTTNPLSNLQVVGDAVEGRLHVSPDMTVNGTSSLHLSEQSTGFLGFEIKYEGATSNQLQVLTNTAGGGETGPWLVIDRTDGSIGFGTGQTGSATTGDVVQPVGADGLLKAAVSVTGIGIGSPLVNRSFNHIPGGSGITVTRLLPGQFEVDFGSVDLTSRFYIGQLGNAFSGSPATGGISVTPRTGVPGALYVRTTDDSGTDIDNNFFLMVY